MPFAEHRTGLSVHRGDHRFGNERHRVGARLELFPDDRLRGFALPSTIASNSFCDKAIVLPACRCDISMFCR
jgi:hypothetical protein